MYKGYTLIVALCLSVTVFADDNALVPARLQLQWVTQAQFAGGHRDYG